VFDFAAIFSDPANWAALVTLVVMEVVLGIDNLIFISILTQQAAGASAAARAAAGHRAGAVHAAGAAGHHQLDHRAEGHRLLGVGQDFSWKDLILIAGGLFLVWKATQEISHSVDPTHADNEFNTTTRTTMTFGAAIAQILLLDIVFSIDSILTAIGMTDILAIMFIAVISAVLVMLLAADPLANFIKRNPSVVMLALGFLLMIGMVLIAEGFGAEVPKGYIYAAMAFSAFVEMLNLWSRGRHAKAAAKAGAGVDPGPDR
jgi:predicted tellurium resistance membrane protein TerC